PFPAAENWCVPKPDPRAVGRWRPVIDSWMSSRRTRRERRPLGMSDSATPRGPSPLARWLACALCVTCIRAGFAADPPPDVNQTKANMLWNIAKFVEWPALPEDRSQPLVFTILGEDDLAASLAGLLSSRTVNGRPVFVRFARRAQD